MKTKFVILVLILVALVIIFATIPTDNKDEFKPLEFEIGDEFSALSYDNVMHILNYGIADVTGDGENDMVIAIGEKLNKSGDISATNIDTVVYDSSVTKFMQTGLKKYNANMPRFLFADVTGDNINDIILIGDNEDITNSLHVITIQNGKAKEIFGKRDARKLEITGDFIDGFKANIKLKKLNYLSLLDLKDKKENYISSGFYSEEGRVKSVNSKIKVTGFNDIELVKFDDYMGIKITQKLKGFDNLDIIDQVDLILKYENNMWIVKEVVGKKLGNLIF